MGAIRNGHAGKGRRVIAALAATMLGLFIVPSSGHAQEKVSIIAWADYIPEDVIKGFEEKTGIAVTYDTFDSLEMLQTKLLVGHSGYDVVFPSALMADRLIAAGVLAKLDKDKLKNLGNLDPKIMTFLARHDPGNRYGLPYLWGNTGIMYNPALIKARMADAPIDSLDMIFKPEVVSKFADCGVAMIDSPEEIVGIALNYLGLDPFTTDPADLKKAEELLRRIRPYIRHFNSGAIINDLAQGDICLALGWSGDASLADARAKEAGNGIDVRYALPKEGTEVFFDFVSIPEDAPHPGNAYAFLDYLMEPKVMADVTNTFFYANGNKASLDYVLDDVKGDPNIYPSAEMMEKLFPNLPRDQKTLRLVNRLWTRFKTGN